ncbi:OmpA/MotB family protein [Kineobactrum salinum]|uniref:OmpA family protein n=1 Tax=Kineobactrum salinum TaxID=2708301 RepID=A0A6C0TXG0_9GAMM|nr:OmpA family protein [Kineobactrum salinum]QIB64318.1 OmpA family protein [Kineobactrum salinum]
MLPVSAAYDDLMPDPPSGEEESWLLSYLDVLTLILTLFVLLLSFANWEPLGSDTPPVEAAVAEATPGETVTLPVIAPLPSAAGDGLLPAHDGLLTQQQAIADNIETLALEGVEATPGLEGMTLRIADHLLFASGQANLTAGGKKVILKLLPLLERYPGEISIEGHTDDVPIQTERFPSNWELASGRAIAVLRFLVGRDLAPERLRAIGYADMRPLESNDSSAGRAANRRVELVLREPPTDRRRADAGQ